MSQENVEIRNEAVRRFVAAFEDDDDSFRDTLHPEIEWYPIEENRTPTRGVKAAMWNRNQWLDTWEEHRLDVEEVIEDGDSAVALIHIQARGKTSGVEVEMEFTFVFTVRDEKIVEWQIFMHEDQALEAAGLSE